MADNAMHNTFAGGAYDRLTERRNDIDWLESALASARARFILAWDQLSPIRWRQGRPEIAWLSNESAGAWRDQARELIFLGERDGPLFGLNFDAPPAADPSFTPADLREVGALLEADDASLLAWFRALGHWHRTHRFCARCGQPTKPVAAGHERDCPACGARHFPRVDPAIIVLVENNDQCLLGAKHNWADDRYSTLAGFVEPGESLEDAVRREVFEEAGVVVAAACYHSAQPWPFPASLMLGFTAVASTRRIALRDGELADARWFSRAAIASGIKAGQLRLPASLSIAHRLIRDWYERDGSRLPVS